MSSQDHGRWWRRAGVLVVALAVAGAVIGARPYAGGWNDGSRLAAAESLGEHGTFAIDESIFVQVPPVVEGHPTPYPSDKPGLLLNGTLDKLFIDGHYYSDKSPVPNVILAGLYKGWLSFNGPAARERPDLYCWFLTVMTSGMAYLVTICAVRRISTLIGLDARTVFLLTTAVAFGSVAGAYSRHVNSHIWFLGAAAVLCLGLARANDQFAWSGWPAIVGTAAGFGYTCDLGIGPPLLLCLIPFCILAYRRWQPVVVVGVAMLPWVLAHHALNHMIGGTLLPANMVAEYLQWPGSPFTDRVMTGGWKHNAGWLVVYAIDLVVGKKGILLHNVPLWIIPGGAILLGLYRPQYRLTAVFVSSWSVLAVMVYAATSTNYGGQCCAVRWFVPLVAPGFWIAALTLREFPQYRPDFTWLTGCGVVLGTFMWRDGPWAAKMVPGLWGWVAAAGAGWGVVRLRAWRTATRSEGVPTLPLTLTQNVSDLTPRSSSAA